MLERKGRGRFGGGGAAELRDGCGLGREVVGRWLVRIGRVGWVCIRVGVRRGERV